jgi:hypothetical protein
MVEVTCDNYADYSNENTVLLDGLIFRGFFSDSVKGGAIFQNGCTLTVNDCLIEDIQINCDGQTPCDRGRGYYGQSAGEVSNPDLMLI